MIVSCSYMYGCPPILFLISDCRIFSQIPLSHVMYIFNWRGECKTMLSDNFVPVFFFVKSAWIFACGFQLKRKTSPCIFFCWFALLLFREMTYAKNPPVYCGIFWRSFVAWETKEVFRFAFVSLNNEINEASLKPPVDVAETTIMNTKLTRLTTGTCTLLAQAFNVRRCKPG